jgi:hypothetical protein
MMHRLRRYVMYDPATEGMGSVANGAAQAVPVAASDAGVSAAPSAKTENKSPMSASWKMSSDSLGAMMMGSPPHQSSLESNWAANAMPDPHMSGSDPRMFPGIVTRSNRSGSLRNLAHGLDGSVASTDLPDDDSAM